VARLSKFKEHGVHVLGSFIFGLTFRSPRHLRGDGCLWRKSRHDLRAVRDDDAISRHRRFRSLGEEHERQRAGGGRRADHALLADSRASAAEDVHAAR
jgi:hypothetical protein